MGMHRGGIGEARYAYAPGRSSAVFCLGRMGLWNGDRDCEPAQLIVAARMGELGREAPPRTERRNPAPVAPRRGFATRLGSRGFSLIEAEADWGKADMGTHFICRVAMEQPRPPKPPPPRPSKPPPPPLPHSAHAVAGLPGATTVTYFIPAACLPIRVPFRAASSRRASRPEPKRCRPAARGCMKLNTTGSASLPARLARR
jgi:hypothetical protein